MNRYIDADVLKQKWLFRGKDGKPYRDEIDAMPTADVREVVHGEWIYDKTSTLWECSNCHEEEIRSTTYCPHCGARNRGGR